MPRTSAAVYRRRRLVVLTGLILLLAAIGVGAWLLVAQPWTDAAPTASPKPDSSSSSSASSTPDPTGTGEATGSPSPTPDDTPGIVACAAEDIVVAAVTDAQVYAEGVLPKISISLTNTSDTDCTLDVGSSTQRITVSSGADEWWRSTDCQENPSSMIATLTAGTTVTSKEPVTWDRTRSSVETCAQENRPRAPGGGASYHVAVSIGGFTSAETRQIILQ